MKYTFSILVLLLTVSLTSSEAATVKVKQNGVEADVQHLGGLNFCRRFLQLGLADKFYNGAVHCGAKFGKDTSYLKQTTTCLPSRTHPNEYTINGEITCNICGKTVIKNEEKSGAHVYVTGADYCKKFKNTTGYYIGPNECINTFGPNATYVRQSVTCTPSATSRYSWTINGTIECCAP